METSQSSVSSEKRGIDDMDRDELIKKYKGVLGILSKAKKAKEDQNKEVAALREKLAECDTQKHADKDCLKTMQLMVDSLTEAKLAATNKMADLEKVIKNLTQTSKNNLARLEELEIENEAQKKQINRLTEENEEQEMDLRKLDEKFARVSELSQQQRQELLVLEQSVDRYKAIESAYQKLQQERKEMEAEIASKGATADNDMKKLIADHEQHAEKLQQQIEEKQRLYEAAEQMIKQLNAELEGWRLAESDGEDNEKIDVVKEQLQHENELLKKQRDEQSTKLEKYKSKVIEFSHKLKELKQSKHLLRETVIEYAKSVSKWQADISHASKLMSKEVGALHEANKQLKESLELSEKSIKDIQNENERLKDRLQEVSTNNAADSNEIREKYEKLLVDFQSLEVDVQNKYNDTEKMAEELQEKTETINQLVDKEKLCNESNERLKVDLEASEKSLKDLKVKYEQLKDRFEELSATSVADSNHIKEKYEMLLVEYKSLEADIRTKNSEIENVATEWEQLCGTLRAENQTARGEIDCLTTQLTEITKAACLSEEKETSLHEMNKQLKEDLEISEQQLCDVRNELEQLKGRLEEVSANNAIDSKEIREKYDQLLATCRSLETDIQSKNSENEKLSAELKEKVQTIAESKENEKLLNEANQQLKNDLLASEQSVNDVKNKFEQAQSRLDEMSTNNAADSNEATEKYAKLMAEFKALEADLKNKNSEIENECKTLREENQKARDEIDNVTTKLAETSTLITEYEEKEKLLNETNEQLKDDLEASEKSLKSLKNECEQLKDRFEEVSTNNAADSNAIKEKYEKLLAEFKSLETDVQNKNDELGRVSAEREQMCSELRGENEKLRSEVEQTTVQLNEKNKLIAGLEEKDKLATAQNDELLAEMRELNDVLKNRGNLISKQTTDLENLQAKLNEQSSKIGMLEESLKEKCKLIEQSRSQYESQSDILSTSTISRADEVARMRDIEDSFEEKYNKVRAVALKYKKKSAEQEILIKKLESTQAIVAAPVESASSTNTSINIQNLKSLQAENDRLLDKIDALTAEQKRLKAEIKDWSQKQQQYEGEIKTLKIVNEDVKAAADTNLKIKSALDETIKNGEKQIEALKQENHGVVQKLKNAENEIIKVRDIVKQKEEEISQKAEEVKKLKVELQKLQSSMKKTSVLNLEVEAYEKSLKEMNQKLETNSKQMTDVKNENKTLESVVQTLTAEVKSLNSQLELEKQNSTDLQQQADLLEIKIKERNQEINELKRVSDDYVKELNTIKIELTNLQSQQSENEVEKQKLISKLKMDNERNVTQLFKLEEEVRDLRSKLSASEQELANVQTDFASYKVRAQSVLRQNKSKDSSVEEELKEELQLITKAKDDLNTKLIQANEQTRHLQMNIDELKGEKQNLQERCKKLLELLDETRLQIETLQNDSRKQTQEHQEALKTHRIQIDTLNNCFKTQIDDIKKKYEDEITTLKATIKSNTGSSEAGYSGTNKNIPITDEQRIEMIMMERQAGEGSESTSSGINSRKISTNSRGKHELIPLDELLSRSFDEELEQNDVEMEDVVTKEKLAVQHSRVKHLSALLSEAELDVARLTEMNAMLKEELRRQERSAEREKHVQNLEYMKNVIFKFLTINNADERSHLVPVLNIILKLSPDECKQLQTVARGGETAQSSWSNILPSW